MQQNEKLKLEEINYKRYNSIMNIIEEIKLYAKKKGVTLSFVAKYLTQRTGKKYTLSSLSKKLKNKTVKFTEMELIANCLGMDVNFHDKINVEEFESIEINPKEIEFDNIENSVFVFRKPYKPQRKKAKYYRGGRPSMVEVF